MTRNKRGGKVQALQPLNPLDQEKANARGTIEEWSKKLKAEIDEHVQQQLQNLDEIFKSQETHQHHAAAVNSRPNSKQPKDKPTQQSSPSQASNERQVPVIMFTRYDSTWKLIQVLPYSEDHEQMNQTATVPSTNQIYPSLDVSISSNATSMNGASGNSSSARARRRG